MTSPYLWSPKSQDISQTALNQYINWLNESGKVAKRLTSYKDAWYWSIENTADFWESMVDYFELGWSYSRVMSGKMPHVSWFEGATLNYAEQVFKKYTTERPALIFQPETGESMEYSWAELKRQVAIFAHFLRAQGVEKGDRVAGYVPNRPEATVAMLATVAIGAVWSSSSPDFGVESVLERFGQIEPKVLVAAASYEYGGKVMDKLPAIQGIQAGLPHLQATVLVGAVEFMQENNKFSWNELMQVEEPALIFTKVDFDHPIWILYSSGTTGIPKAITHSHGGMLLEHLKYLTFHADIKQGERFFWYTTTGWMMWNFVQSALLVGATIVLYDGNPMYPAPDRLWKMAADLSLEHFGTSAAFVLACMKAEVKPATYDLSRLRQISSTGSPLPPEAFDWIYTHTKPSIWLTSMSGGTDVCTAFVGGNPILPVVQGEIQCPALGCALFAVNEAGAFLQNEVGEMVITQPMPCMPIYFWNDEDFIRYKEAYFELFPGWWRHGDWVMTTPHLGLTILGRSDATLNRFGIRIGTSEIYRSVEKLRWIQDSLVVNIELNGGESKLVLFVQLIDNEVFDENKVQLIKQQLRTDYSPRHVPDFVHVVSEIPYTMSGKKMEIPVKKVLMGKPIQEVAKEGTMRNPMALKHFEAVYQSGNLMK